MYNYSAKKFSYVWLPIMNMCSNFSYSTNVKYTILILKIQVFWDVMSCQLVNRYQHSVRFKHLRLQDKNCIIYWHDILNVWMLVQYFKPQILKIKCLYKNRNIVLYLNWNSSNSHRIISLSHTHTNKEWRRRRIKMRRKINEDVV